MKKFGHDGDAIFRASRLVQANPMVGALILCGAVLAAPATSRGQAEATVTSVSSGNNPSFTANSVTLTATVSAAGQLVNQGVVSFSDNGNQIGNGVLVGFGEAATTTSFTTEGTHLIKAAFLGTATYAASSGTLTQVANNHTVVSGNGYSNPGSLTLNNPTGAETNASPYPSEVFVSGLNGTVCSAAVTLKNVSYPASQDLDVLLVAPTGKTLILVASLGPSSGGGMAVSSSTVTFSDTGTLPVMTTPWGSGSTFKPVNFGGANEVWGTPAPGAPYGDPGTTGAGATFASAFDGASPNGTWSLYAISTAAGEGMGAIAGGWTLILGVAGTPSATAQSVNAGFNTPTGITLTGTDPNTIPAQTLNYVVVTNPTHGVLSGTAPNLTYTPNAGYHGGDGFAFTVANGNYTSAAANVSIQVAAGTPAANAQSDAVYENATNTRITLSANDPDIPALPLTYTISSPPTHGALAGMAPNLAYTPAPNYVGPDAFQFTAGNGTATSAPATVSITVINISNITNLLVGAGASLSFGFSGIPNATYELQYTPTLTPPAWGNVGPVTTGPQGAGSYAGTNAPFASGFYRLAYPAP